MTTLAQVETLMAVIILITGMASLVWSGMATVARVAPRASWGFAAANATATLALVLHGMRDAHPYLVTLWPADTLAIAACALVRAAVPAVATRRFAWRSALAIVAASGLVLSLLPYEPGADLRWQVRLVSVAGGVLMLLAALDARRFLLAGRARRLTVALLTAPLFLIAVLMGIRALQDLLQPGRTTTLLMPTDFNLRFLWGMLCLGMLQNAALAFLVLMRLIERLRRLTERDPLTDVLNRRAFNQALDTAHAWLGRGRGYALVMIDMDRFKQLNDTLGHAAGDAALQLLVHELQACLREADQVGRLGGEEFCVLLPDTGIAGAALVAERMRARVDATPLQWQGRSWPLSASFGIAEAEAGDPRAEVVLGRADAALYRAKSQGRNVVQA